MLQFEAKSISIGIGDGSLYIFDYNYDPKEKKVSNEKSEFEQIEFSINMLKDNLQKKMSFYKDKGQDTIDYIKEHIKILSAQNALLCDEAFIDDVKKAILANKMQGDYAVKCSFDAFLLRFKPTAVNFSKDDYDKLSDIYKQIIKTTAQNALIAHCNNSHSRIALFIGAQINADVLIQISSKVCALIIKGNELQNYHSILANSENIPCVALYNNCDDLKAGERTMLDGEAGLIVQNPNTDTKTTFARKHLFLKRQESGSQHLKGVPAVSINGINVKLSSVASSVKNVKAALMNNADSISILYTDVIFELLEPDMFDEDYIYNFYRDIFLLMGKKQVTVLINPCKQNKNYKISFENTSFESNMFFVNLRAILRASAYGNIRILLKDISSEHVVSDFKNNLQLLRKNLVKENKIINSNIEVGIMITTYYAALIADILAYCSDFFYIDINSISDNILSSVNLSDALKGKERVTNFAVLRSVTNLSHLINRACKKSVCFSGLSASDTTLVDFYLSIGANELCVLPNYIPVLKRSIRAITKEDCAMALKKYLTPN